jgi:uncharacterized protein YegP (UPF0339 family)
MNNPKFELYKSNANSQFYFRLLAQNGANILGSEGYTTKASCENGIQSVKVNAPLDTRYERKTNNVQFWFTLKAGNGEVIGKSQMYSSTTARDAGIESVKLNAPVAPTDNLD